MNVTFLEAKTPLSKTFTENGATSYPLAKNFTSHRYFIPTTNEGIEQKYELIKEHAAKGHCLYKGNLSEDITNASRRGKTDKLEKTESLILDIDGLPTEHALPNPIDKHSLVWLTESFITKLPTAFHKASYITQASASMGMKGQRLNLHIEFFLSRPIAPRALKDLLTALNFECSAAKEAITLAASGTCLCYPIDVCLADNSRIIYIAPPKFEEGISDPFKSDEDRIEFVQKDHPTVDVLPMLEGLNAEFIKKQVNDHVRVLRRSLGLPSKRSKTQTLEIRQGMNKESVNVVTNPDLINLEFVSDNGAWLQFNRVGGDSRGYYVAKDSPNVLRNFKGEDYVLLSEADKDTYEWIVSNYATDEENPSEPICFRDYNSNIIYNGFYNPTTNELTDKIAATSLSNVADFYAFYGRATPDVMPQMRYSYNPPGKSGVDFNAGTVNAFRPSEYMKNADQIELPQDLGLAFGHIESDLTDLCPNICKVIKHAVGGDTEALERFLNWVAFIFQTRDKTETAWVIHGVPGTGKGTVYHDILNPLLGEANTSHKEVHNLDDDKNAWVSQTLLVMIDEFQYQNSSNWQRSNEKLKLMITDKKVTVRMMRTDQFDATCWTNFIICSNHIDPIKIEPKDRRYNICPRQEKPLKDVLDDIDEVINELIPAELPTFATYLNEYNIDRKAVRNTWENDAKAKMQETTLTTPEEFCWAIKKGDLEYFLPLLETNVVTDLQADYQRAVQPILKRWIQNAKDSGETADVCRITLDDISTIYNALSENSRTTPNTKVAKLLAHNGITCAKQRINNRIARCINARWQLQTISKQELLEAYVPDSQSAVPPSNIAQFKPAGV